MEFWNSDLTEKSWKILLGLKKTIPDFIVIGGWAAYLWTNQHKSKDIDIIIKNFEDLNALKKEYNLVKNDNLKKYEIKIGEIDIDIYVPFFSKLTMPIDGIEGYTAIIQNMEVIKPEILLILKQSAEQDRENSVKGEKDRIDIMTLICYSDIDFREYLHLLKKHGIGHLYQRLKHIISGFKDIKYLNLNPRQFKLKKQEITRKLKTL